MKKLKHIKLSDDELKSDVVRVTMSKRGGASEIEVTPEMIRAGAEVIWRCFDETIPYGSSFGEFVAELVYRAMRGLPEPD